MQTTEEQVGQLIRQAEKHIDREEWDEVAETLEAGRLRLIADYLMGEEGAYAEAVETLERMAALAPLSPDARRLYGEARWWRDNDHYICWVL